MTSLSAPLFVGGLPVPSGGIPATFGNVYWVEATIGSDA